MADTVLDSKLKRDAFLFNALEAFQRKLIAISVFAMAIRNATLEGTSKIIVPYHPLHTTASKDFSYADGYVFDDNGAVNARELTINKRKYQALSTTSEQANRQPADDPAALGRQKGAKLATDVMTDILSIVTVANYGADVLDSDPSAFTKEDAIDLKTVADQAEWPEGFENRHLVLKSAHANNMLKDAVILDQSSYGSLEPIREGRVREIAGFSGVTSEHIPANAENLVGFICYPSAALVGFAPIVPERRVMAKLDRYEQMTDEMTGLTLEYREWGDPDFDTGKETLEVNYGFGLGEAAALKRIIDTP